MRDTAQRTAPEGGNPRGRNDQVGAGSSSTLQPASHEDVTADTAVYRPSTVKRSRATNAMLDTLDDAIITVLVEEHPATVRGTYYRMVAAGAVEKTEAGYRQVGRQVLKLRRAGVLPYSWITDGTRLRHKLDTWTDLDEMLADAASSYRRALWADQDAEVIILSEKDAISGAILPVTYEWDVELAITRGYSSETFTYSIASTVKENTTRGKTTYIYQLGDHDPAGVDGWRAFRDKVHDFAPAADVVFERLAVTPAQIEKYGLPTRPTKGSDSRAAKFVGESVEVDAIAPTVLRAIVRAAIEQHIDPDALALTRTVEASERDVLARIVGWSA